MTDDDFLKFVPRCAECREMLPPSDPAGHAALRVHWNGHWRDFDFHAECAPAPCKPGHITTVTSAVDFDGSMVARWVAA